MSKRFTSSLAGAAVTITIFTLISRGLGFFREIIFAAFYGLGLNYEIYLVASILPLTINTIILILAQNYFIPTYHKISQGEFSNASDFILSSLNLFLFCSIFLTFFLFLFSLDILEIYFDNLSYSQLDSANLIFKILIISIPFNAINAILIAYFQSNKDFYIAAFSNTFLNIIIITLVLIFNSIFNIYIISFSYLIATILQLIYLYYNFSKKIKFRFIFLLKSKLFKYTGSFFIMTILIETISQIQILADRYFIGSVDQGGIAALNYALILFQIPSSIIPYAISTALFTSISELFHKGNIEDVKEKVGKSLNICMFLMIPISVIFFYWGDELIKILFQRGVFGEEDVKLTYNCLIMLAYSLLFYTIYAIVYKLFYSFSLLRELLIIISSGIILKIILNFILVKELRQDGLALSSCLTYIYYCLVSLFFIQKKIKVSYSKLFSQVIVYTGNAIISTIVSILIMRLLGLNILIIPFSIFLYLVSHILINRYSFNYRYLKNYLKNYLLNY